MKTKLFIATILLASVFSCKKDATPDGPLVTEFLSTSDGIYIANEGLFNSGNSSITYSEGSVETTIQNVFAQVNDSVLGDICQSMVKIQDKIYLVVNNSSKIEVAGIRDMKHIATITGLTSPRYFCLATATKAYVSDLYSNHLSIVDLTSNTVTGTIELSGSTEEMLNYNGKIYVTNLSTSYLYIVDIASDQLEDSILIGPGGNSLRLDKNNKIWILCGGDYITSAPGSLHRINPVTKTDELALTFASGDFPTRLRINETNDVLYFLDNNVYKMAITENTLPTTAFITANGRSFYGLGYDKLKQKVYVSDAIDYQQSGRVYKYGITGIEETSFPAGIIPGDFLFLGN